VERADVMTSSDGRSKGFGTVRFLNPEAASKAVEMNNNTELEGRTLAVFLDKFA
jgi:RNA recognition motif-containing protein